MQVLPEQPEETEQFAPPDRADEPRWRAAAGRIARGAAAGAIATAPMSLAMFAMHRRLPRRERYPLPPRLITDTVVDAAGDPADAGPQLRRATTWVSHFGYGALCGGLYGAIAPERSARAMLAGVPFGLGVWTLSYLGWLPLARIFPPATRVPARRNALMIAAHVVWGLSLGAAWALLTRDTGAGRTLPRRTEQPTLLAV